MGGVPEPAGGRNRAAETGAVVLTPGWTCTLLYGYQIPSAIRFQTISKLAAFDGKSIREVLAAFPHAAGMLSTA